MSEDAIGYVINLRGPLCRTCLQDWGASEDDFDRPAVRRAHFLELVPFWKLRAGANALASGANALALLPPPLGPRSGIACASAHKHDMSSQTVTSTTTVRQRQLYPKKTSGNSFTRSTASCSARRPRNDSLTQRERSYSPSSLSFISLHHQTRPVVSRVVNVTPPPPPPHRANPRAMSNHDPDDRLQLINRLAVVRARLRAIEEQIDFSEWKTLFNEMISLQRRIHESERDTWGSSRFQSWTLWTLG